MGNLRTKKYNFLATNKIEKMTIKKQIKINPDPYKLYNLAQGYVVNNMLYISGQTAYDLSGKLTGINNFDIQAE